MAFSNEVSKYHDILAAAMLPHKGSVMTNQEIKKILFAAYPESQIKEIWIFPSDHCRNHTCKGACSCTMSEKAIFDRIGRGKYLVL